MAEPDRHTAHVIDKLLRIGPVQTAREFGGLALKLHGRPLGMLMNGRCFVVDDRTRPTYERAGSVPFSYSTKKRRVDLRRYFEVPAKMRRRSAASHWRCNYRESSVVARCEDPSQAKPVTSLASSPESVSG